jgi:phage tail sheath protein FI
MALVSPGVSVTVTDDSFFIPAAASTVPLFFLATASEKLQPNGTDDALGTFEHSRVRTITSLAQSVRTYGVPVFKEDTNGNAFHGDARNEYGLFAMNQFLGVGNRAYALRANVNLNDDRNSVLDLWQAAISQTTNPLGAADQLALDVTDFINAFNTANNLVPASLAAQVVNVGGAVTAATATNIPVVPTSGWAEVDITGTIVGTDATGLLNDATVYNDEITIDGGAPIALALTGSTVQTYTDLIAGINTAIGAAGNAAIVDGNLRITSASTGVTSTVAIAAGSTPLFSALTNFVSLPVPTAGAASTARTATVTINGVVNNISILEDSIATYGDLITQLNADITNGVASIVGGNIQIVQNVSGSGVSIVDGGLFAALPDFDSIETATPAYKSTVSKAELLPLAIAALDDRFGTVTSGVNTLWEESTFSASRTNFIADLDSAPLDVFGNGYDQPATATFVGLEGMMDDWITMMSGSVVNTEWTATEARDLVVNAGNGYQFTMEFLNETSLGNTDADRRAAIVTALQAAINSNQDIRAETIEYNLIVAPGFPEVVDEMQALSVELKEEAMVIADTPMTMNPEDVVTWADGSIAPWPRIRGTNVAYYYPAGLASNLDGKEVVCAASGIALRTITLSDNASDVWFAPAGIRRGTVSGISQIGYISGTLGAATTFNQVFINQGQRDNLYKYTTNVNPIVNFPGRGIIVWGQKTSAPAASARDRINVERMLMHVRRQLRKNTLPFIFEPNDQLTRDSLKAVVDGFLGDIMIRRGLFDFATVCDESNNTPDRIDRNEMYIDVALKPTKAAEFLFIPIRVVNTGTDI